MKWFKGFSHWEMQNGIPFCEKCQEVAPAYKCSEIVEENGELVVLPPKYKYHLSKHCIWCDRRMIPPMKGETT